MKKYLLALPLVLALISCKEIKVVKGPDGKTSICTSQIAPFLPGVQTAVQETKCVVLSCLDGYSKYDIEAFVNSYDTDRNECLAFYPTTPHFCPPEISPEIRQYVADYPKVCTPAAQACNDTQGITEGNGERPWIGLDNRFRFISATVSEEPNVEAGISMEEATPEQLLEMGYGECQPKDENSCEEGYIYTVFDYSQMQPANAMTEQMIVKRCVAQEESCYYDEETNITSYVRYFDSETQQYGDCTVTSCQEGYEIIDNSCQLIQVDPCIENPQSGPECAGYDMCLDNPNQIGCPGFDMCTIMPMMPGCPGFVP